MNGHVYVDQADAVCRSGLNRLGFGNLVAPEMISARAKDV